MLTPKSAFFLVFVSALSVLTFKTNKCEKWEKLVLYPTSQRNVGFFCFFLTDFGVGGEELQVFLHI